MDLACSWCEQPIREDDGYVREGERVDHADPCYGLRMRQERDDALEGAVQISDVVRVLRERGDTFTSRRTRGAFYMAAEIVADVFGSSA